MRPLTLIAALSAALPGMAGADDIALTSKVDAVTLYPQGATIRREVEYSAPEGQHRLILIDLPEDTDLASVRASVTGAQMGSITVRRDAVPPRGDRDTDRIEAARADVERREEALAEARAEIARARLAVDAAKAEAQFLAQLGKGEGVAGLDVAGLREMAKMIRQETLAARQAAHDAAREADIAKRDLKDMIEALEDARQALAALTPETEPRAMLAVEITADAATTGTLSLSYQSGQAGWSPVYDMRLARKTGALEIERGAYLHQETGENWRDVALTLSTVRPSGQARPSEIEPLIRRIGDPPPKPMPLMRKEAAGSMLQAEADSMRSAAPVIEASVDFDGISATYSYEPPVSVASGADALRIRLGTTDASAEMQARAVPLYDKTAYLMAEFTNDSGEPILPGETHLYLDGTHVAQISGEMIAAGAEADLPFGPIEGLRLSRVVPEREEGGSGLIRKSSDLSETVRIEIENLTGEAWPLRVLDRVPQSEQEALRIDWSADPAPSEQNVDGAPGVLAWDLEMAPDTEREIRLDYELQWPEDKVLHQRPCIRAPCGPRAPR